MTQVVVSSGATWTVPADCIAATVELIGAGQGGNATNGGNGGDYAKVTAVNLTPGASVPVQIGAGGVGVSSGAQNAGTDTKFSTVALAKGGGSASTSIGDATFAGGLGDASGGGGGAAGPNAAGGAASGSSGGQGDGTTGGLGGASGAAGAAGTEWGTVGSGGGGGAFAASGPAFVQGNTAPMYGSSVTVTLTGVPVSGDLLIAAVTGGGTAPTSAPAGWTLFTTINSGVPDTWIYTKTSNGAETGVTVNFASTTSGAASISEWSGAVAGSVKQGQGLSTSVAISSNGAGMAASSIPLLIFGCSQLLTSAAVSPGTWSGQFQPNTGHTRSGGYYYEAAPNAAVSATLALSTSGTTNWCVIWIDP